MFGFFANKALIGRVASGVQEVQARQKLMTGERLAGVCLMTAFMRLQFEAEGIPGWMFRNPGSYPKDKIEQAFKIIAGANQQARDRAQDLKRQLHGVAGMDPNNAEIITDHFDDIQLGIEILQLTVGCGIATGSAPELRKIWMKIAWAAWGERAPGYLSKLQAAMDNMTSATGQPSEDAVASLKELAQGDEVKFWPDFLR